MKSILFAGVTALAIMSPSVAVAQAPASGAPADAEAPQGVGLADIVVTARQRSESLQDVPVAVAAMNADMIERAFVPNVDAVERFMPNVELGRHPFTGGGMSASIRGVSFGDLDRAFEPAVAVSVDGIFLASNTGAMMDTFDIASLEVLRGPQGTLFGRNTIGGVISIKRTQPTMDWGLKLQGTIGSYGNRELRGIANIPIVKDVVGLKVGGYIERSDSYTRNYVTGKRDDGIDKKAIFGALRIVPNDVFEATLSVDHIKDDSQYPGLVPISADNQAFCVNFGACLSTLGQVAKDSGYKLSFSQTPFTATLDSTAVTLNMKLDTGAIALESITGYMKQKDALSIENSGALDRANGAATFVSTRNQKAMQFSHELRAISDFDGAFNFVAGAYYMRSTFELLSQQVRVAGALSQNFTAGQKLDAYAAYAEGYLEVVPDLNLTVGGRYTVEQKAFTITHFGPGASSAVIFTCPDATLPGGGALESCRDSKVEFKKFTPRVLLDYRFSPDVMVYGGWSRGYRSGGWNSRATVATAVGPYRPETVDSYELGLRTSFLQNKGRFNLTLFHATYKDKQEEVITASPLNPLVTQTLVENAASAKIKGLEGELEFLPFKGLRLRGALGYIDGKYDEFLQGGVDVSASRNLRYAPKWSVSFGGDVTIPMGNGEIQMNANYKWTDRFATAVVRDTLGLNRDFISDYATVDAAIGYQGKLGSGRSTYKVAAFVNNAFHNDGRLYRKVITGPFSFASQEAGRTWGLELTFTY
ncbi:TonB-dependent receptor [Sphingobium sp. CECT 9361]|uniref:TonB-dependent receptor n=1 Tax=Sphingobium sp. CECT 9361 TaxID=2845384 RepID=UPI001E576A61|nr:TonB-dependent receptor [Sphingobium sp. CECT 9361]CAH0356957.1 Pesticin receptor [Sphingobium sp. CECT 9361]